MKAGKWLVTLGVIGLIWLNWKPWRAPPIEAAAGPFVVVLAGDLRTWSRQADADVVWSPTAGELTVPAELEPKPGEQVLVFSTADGVQEGWHWLSSLPEPVGDAVMLRGIGANGELLLQTPDGVAALPAGTAGTYRTATGMPFHLYYAGTFARLAIVP